MLTILDGPPGTGKTSTLLPLIDAWATCAPPGWCVSIVAASNAALDHLCYVLHAASQRGILGVEFHKVVRYARLTALHPDYREHVGAFTPDGRFKEKYGYYPDSREKEDMNKFMSLRDGLV